MLQVLTNLLPPTAGRGAESSRCSVRSAISYLLDFVPVIFFSYLLWSWILEHW